MKPEQPKNLEGRILSLNELKEMEFKETDRCEDYRLYWYSRNQPEEEVMGIRLLSCRESFQIISHYIK